MKDKEIEEQEKPILVLYFSDLEELDYTKEGLKYGFRKGGGFKNFVLNKLRPHKKYEYCIYTLDAQGQQEHLLESTSPNWKEMKQRILSIHFPELMQAKLKEYWNTHCLIAELWTDTEYHKNLSSYMYYWNDSWYPSSGKGERHTFERVCEIVARHKELHLEKEQREKEEGEKQRLVQEWAEAHSKWFVPTKEILSQNVFKCLSGFISSEYRWLYAVYDGSTLVYIGSTGIYSLWSALGSIRSRFKLNEENLTYKARIVQEENLWDIRNKFLLRLKPEFNKKGEWNKKRKEIK